MPEAEFLHVCANPKEKYPKMMGSQSPNQLIHAVSLQRN
jgi:hypothetical protein